METVCLIGTSSPGGGHHLFLGPVTSSFRDKGPEYVNEGDETLAETLRACEGGDDQACDILGDNSRDGTYESLMAETCGGRYDEKPHDTPCVDYDGGLEE